LLKGTNFQVNVWQALLVIPRGAVVSYQDVAAYIGQPNATRAVANAIAHNPIGYLIPCHRVIRKDGTIHGYQWGRERKQAILGWEASCLAPT
jgi:AraC family transcriptional regulator of adaptative response/methylated-DNA-[protein]-cysteine methyltransferase